MSSSVFFFQAEDGIRDLTVTGVQTCALPISHGVVTGPIFTRAIAMSIHTRARSRSEERRVGKECRSGGVAEREGKKTDGVGARLGDGVAGDLDSVEVEHQTLDEVQLHAAHHA